MHVLGRLHMGQVSPRSPNFLSVYPTLSCYGFVFAAGLYRYPSPKSLL